MTALFSIVKLFRDLKWKYGLHRYGLIEDNGKIKIKPSKWVKFVNILKQKQLVDDDFSSEKCVLSIIVTIFFFLTSNCSMVMFIPLTDKSLLYYRKMPVIRSNNL